jgi:hypothetical protein
MDENRFFYLQYQYNGEYINKKLPFRENNLILSRTEILKVDGQPIPALDTPETTLNYYTPAGSQFISSFELIFPDMDLLKNETGILLEEFSDRDYAIKVNELSAYIYEFYGKPDKEDVMKFLENDFGLSK